MSLQQLDQLADRIAQAKALVERQRQENSELNATCAKLNATCSELRAEVEAARAERDQAIEKQARIAEEAIEQSVAELRAVTQARDAAQDELSIFGTQIEEFRAQMARLPELKQEVARLASRCEAIPTLETTLGQERAESDRLRLELNQKEQRLEEAAHRIEAMLATLALLETAAQGSSGADLDSPEVFSASAPAAEPAPFAEPVDVASLFASAENAPHVLETAPLPTPTDRGMELIRPASFVEPMAYSEPAPYTEPAPVADLSENLTELSEASAFGLDEEDDPRAPFLPGLGTGVVETEREQFAASEEGEAERQDRPDQIAPPLAEGAASGEEVPYLLGGSEWAPEAGPAEVAPPLAAEELHIDFDEDDEDDEGNVASGGVDEELEGDPDSEFDEEESAQEEPFDFRLSRVRELPASEEEGSEAPPPTEPLLEQGAQEEFRFE
jgi:flagellar biosynthesis chaperone FliJ